MITRLWQRLSIPLLLFLPGTVWAEMKKVVYGIDDFCPYTCLEKDRPGILPEAIAVILGRQRMTLEILPGSWTRLEKEGEKGNVDLLGPLTLRFIKRTRVPSTQVLGGFFKAGFMTRSDSSWIYTGPESLRNKRLVTVKGYSYPVEVKAFLDTIRDTRYLMELSGENANRRRVQMLAQGRVDAVPTMYNIFHHQVKLLNMNAADFRSAGDMPLSDDTTTFRIGVFNKDPVVSKELIRILDKGFVDISKDKTLKSILARYGIQGEQGLN
ncbi:MAG TPA: transporter substrate-binding domain-containing protein [Oligoflexus sp.]|uniref:substrate-binding periplasmic protein n=1 Tax=Oligoflexus sp. TaxID=1971216 RepID=UPI002D2B6AED|nr:transporter substrate-binding domain-containing protein [Oligoflexus sp.]HYX34980.1 transporter substrate-binding domain-containing protein [Oligoflexus sp.]